MSPSTATPAQPLANLIDTLVNGTDEDRGTAWQAAGPAGAPAVQPLARLMTHPGFEVARSAQRAIQRIVRHAGRPGAGTDTRDVERELVALLRNDAAPVRRAALWWLSEIGGDTAVSPMAAQLTDPETREDARCALTRMPGDAASAALRKAFEAAPEAFRFALAESLRHRGGKVDGYPSRKLTPTRSTVVGAASP